MSEQHTCDGCRSLEPRVSRLERLLFGEATEPARADGSPLALSMADMVTPRQLSNIRRMARGAALKGK
ncbi:MAG TPA: hypothetical protein VGB98_00115 [Pyrinomonadaceae bacterium]